LNSAVDGRVSLKFSDFGVATAYVNLAFGTSPDEADQLVRSDARLLHLIGQSDLAVSFATEEFRDFLSVDAAYPRAQTSAFALNWSFAVPYDFGALDARRRWGQGQVATDQDTPLSFFVHLRLRRAIFAYTGAEAAVVAKLRDLLSRHELDAHILAAVGWSDLIIDGTVAADRLREFTQFLVKAHELYLPIQDQKLAAFQRTLTIFGYSHGAVPTAEGMRHVTFARTVPGRYSQARETLRTEFASPLYRMSLIDGKLDFMVSLAEPPPPPLLDETTAKTAVDDPTFFRRQQRLMATAAREDSLQRMESHLLLSDVEPLLPVADEEVAVWQAPRAAEHLDCACATHSYDRARCERAFRALPIGLQQAINNLLLLFSAALKDATTCCDALPAILSCEESLTTLLESFERLIATLPRTSPMTAQQLERLGLDAKLASLDAQLEDSERLLALYPEGVNVNRLLAERYRYFEDWHLYAERVLSQRTVGSFEEMLGHTDKVTTYRGGAQKFLYLADGLVRDFTSLIPRTAGLAFTTLYDSVHTIIGVRGSHFIRIPVRHVFTLPLGIADLWHEVGVALFNLRYDPEDIARAAEESSVDADELYETLGDAYGDFVVFLFGFRGNFGRFADSLIKGWRDSRIPGGLLVPHEVLTRLYLVLELAYARVLVRKKPDQATPSAYVFRLVAYLRELVLRRYPDDKQSLDADKPLTWLTLADRVTRTEFWRFRARIHDFIDAEIPRGDHPSTTDLLEGSTIELADDADLNALFADYVAPVIFPRAGPKLRLFRSMAAIVKSGSYAYFRRAARRRTTVANSGVVGSEEAQPNLGTDA
jgi:hypothetical protein